MTIKRVLIAVGVALGLSLASPVIAKAESFGWIMGSLSKAGAVKAGNGKKWAFTGKRGEWRAHGGRGVSASVYSSGNNRVRISGFPDNWNADDDYRFKKQGNICRLNSYNGRYKLQWRC